jgi:Putative Actinobacterial Holin-X, holin superfamily III
MSAPVLDSTEVREAGTARGLIASVVSDAQRLVALEIALAKQEAKELATRNAIAAGVIAFGGLLLVLGVLVALPSLAVWLLPWHWQAAAVWVGAYLVLGLLLVIIGRSRLQLRLPPRTIGSLKENKEWALRRVRSNGK